MKLVPLIGSPPMPIQVLCPRLTAVVCATASYVSVPDRDTTPILPFKCMWPGMIPILHSFGVITPGQLGPIRRVLLEFCRDALTATISSTGMPSVMQIASSISQSIASLMASAANGGGTYMTEALAPVSCTASDTVSKTGKPKCSLPPFPGETPPTICVP